MSEDLVNRPRRLRLQPQLREMLQRIDVRRSDIICPVFVRAGSGQQKAIESMPGISQMSVDVAADWLSVRAEAGHKAFIAFGVIDRAEKDEAGSAACDPNNVICRLIREVKRRAIPMAAMTDLCLCEYTDHGHCGPLTTDRSTVDNDATVDLLVKQAINHAQAGADVIAPSGMMDGAVGAVRRGLDQANFTDVAIMAYAVKFASAFYGPFREAADSTPSFGDRRGYQMDPARGIEEAIREVTLDVEQGADLVIVKPAGSVSRCDCRSSQTGERPGRRLSGERRIFDDRGGGRARMDRPRACRTRVASRNQAGRRGLGDLLFLVLK